MVARAAGAYQSFVWLIPLHIEFMLLGWTVQLAMAVSYWILPRRRSGPVRGNERLAVTAFIVINGGVLTASLAGLLETGVLATAGHGAEVLGAFTFAVSAWHRLPRSIVLRGRSLPII